MKYLVMISPIIAILLLSGLHFVACEGDKGDSIPSQPTATPTANPTEPTPTPSAQATATPTPQSNCPQDMAYIPELGICMDIYEYPNIAGQMPMIYMTWYEANAVCEGLGKRFCDHYEWQQGCGGPGGLTYPYGNAYRATVCNGVDAGYGAIAPSGHFDQCVSPYGIYDMSGNVWEFVANLSGGSARVCGGSFEFGSYGLQCSQFLWQPADQQRPDTGFRCCMNEP